MNTIFEILFYEAQYRHRYPSYRLRVHSQSFSPTLQEAEHFIQAMLRQPQDDLHPVPRHIHHIRVRQLPIGSLLYTDEYLAEYIYDDHGQRIDETEVSTIRNADGDFDPFWGREPARIRFREGDIVEVFYGDRVELAFVAELPISKDRATQINTKAHPFHLDSSDDSYVVMTTSDYMRSHDHIASTNLFPPHYKVPTPILNRLRKAYKNSQRASVV